MNALVSNPCEKDHWIAGSASHLTSASICRWSPATSTALEAMDYSGKPEWLVIFPILKTQPFSSAATFAPLEGRSLSIWPIPSSRGDSALVCRLPLWSPWSSAFQLFWLVCKLNCSFYFWKGLLTSLSGASWKCRLSAGYLAFQCQHRV